MRHPRLALIWVWPVLLFTGCLATGIWLAFSWDESLLATVWSRPDGQEAGWWPAMLRFLYGAAAFLIAVVLSVVALVAALLVANVLGAPFNDALGERVERQLLVETPEAVSPGVLLDLVRSVRMELSKMALYAAVMVPLFLLSWLVPVVGQVLYAIVGFGFTTFYLAFDFVDGPASRRGWGFRRRLALFRTHAGAMAGLGMGIWLILAIPLVNLLLVPAAVAGGTILFLDFEAGMNGEPPGAVGGPRP
ncbi:MAG: EI24 domain-containing protein [Myxococcales bacterium]|nr:EI24 domain-containing protein [Myxococcales bacterium]